MKISLTKITLASIFVFLFNNNDVSAQDSGVTVNQDPKFEQLLDEKRKINSSITANDRYKIQIFYGDIQNARKVLAEFQKNFPNLDATIIFSSPNYKVQVGNFKTKIEADRNRQEILTTYQDALVVKPAR
ncbi:MAG: SPOR domain-containing protein [Flavobacteriaceae bacterium]